MHRQGGRLVAEGCLNQAILQEIVAGEKQAGRHAEKSRRKSSHIIFYTILFSLMLGPAVTPAPGTNKQKALSGNAPTQGLRLTPDQAVGLALTHNTTAHNSIL